MSGEPSVPSKNVKNAHVRSQLVKQAKQAKAKAKLSRRLAQRKAEQADPSLREERLSNNIPRTIENTREYVGDEREGQEGDARTRPVRIEPGPSGEEGDFKLDMAGLEDLFGNDARGQGQEGAEEGTSEPGRILLTTAPRPSPATYLFLSELQSLLGGKERAEIIPRKNARFELGKVTRWARKRGWGGVIVVGEDHGTPSTLTVCRLPQGPTAMFRVTSIYPSKSIYNHAVPTSHMPELVLTNFITPLGLSVGRLLQGLFPPLPQIEGRQVVVVHNQRDFIFVRRFRYMFALRDQNKKKREHEDQHIRTKMQEIGPRLTLKLRWLKRGTLADDEKDSGLPAGKGFKGDAKGKGKEDGAAEDVEVDYTGGRGEQADEDEGDDDAKAEADALHEAGLSNDIEPAVEGGTEDPTGIASDQGVPQPPPDDGKAPPSNPTKKRSKKRKRKTEEDEPQWETEPVAPKKKAAEKSVLDQSSALMRGRSGKESWEWVWKPKMQVSRRRFFL